MITRFLFITLLLCIVCSPATAQEVIIKDIEGPSKVCKGDLRDFMHKSRTSVGMSKVKFSAKTDNTVINYRDRITNMPQYLNDFIDQYTVAGKEVLNGGSNWLSDPSKGEIVSSSYTHILREVTDSAPFSFPAGSSSDAIKSAAVDAFSDQLDSEYDVLESFLPYAFLSANYDHPEIFWIGNEFKYGRNCKYSISYYPSGTGTVTYTITLILILYGQDFDIRANGISTYNFCNTTNLYSGVQSFNSYVQTILDQCPVDGSRYEKLVAAHDWLTHNNCYNPYFPQYSQSQIGDTPWSSFSALEGNNGQPAPVCEGYARAFKVLCDTLKIPCILMSGNARSSSSAAEGSHMWNYVQMENGKWYAVDVTWDDPSVKYSYNAVSGYESHDWFLLGSTSDIGDGFTFIESHPEEWFKDYSHGGSYSWDLISGPELAQVAWSPEEDRDPCDINHDGIIDEEDINLMAEKIVNDDKDIEDIDGNDRITIGDLVLLIKRHLSE